MIESADQDDPLDWSIDRVIEELCHKQQPTWMIDTNIKPFNNPVTLENVLTDNDIDGDALLNLDESSIRADLGIVSFGQRYRLKQIISVLRRHSQKYEPSNLDLDLKPQLSHEPYNSRASVSAYARSRPATSKSPNIDVPSRSSHTPTVHLESRSDTVALTSELQVERSRSSKHQGKQEVGLLNELESHLDEELSTRPGQDASVQQNVTPGNNYVDSSNTKRRRLALENISTQPLTIVKPVLAASKVPQINSRPAPDHQRTLLSQTLLVSTELEDLAQQHYKPKPTPIFPAYKNLVNTKLATAYSNLIDGDVGLRTEFAWVASSPDTKMQRIAAKHTKNSMVAGTSELGYGVTLAEVQNHKFGHSRPKQVHVVNSAEPLALSTAEDSSRTITIPRFDVGEGVSDSSPAPKDIGVETMEDGYQRLLEQYPADENDDVLPLYGQSDEEDRYVTDGSISDANGRDDPVPVVESNQLSTAEIDAVIDEAIVEFKANWASRRLPKVQQKAHNKWMLAFKIPGIRAKMIKVAQTDHESASRRLPNFRSALHDSIWTKASDLKQLCDALSATVDLIEESNYFIQVLESEQEPTQPLRETAKQLRIRRDPVPGEVNCSSDEDSINDFVTNGTTDELTIPRDPMDEDWNPQLAVLEQNVSGKEIIDKERQATNFEAVDSSAIDVALAETSKTSNIMDIQDDEVTISVEQDVMKDVQFDIPRTPVRVKNFVDNTADADDEAVSISSTKRTKSAKKRALNDSKKRNPIALPHFSGSSDNSDMDSDFDRSSRVPGTKYKKQGRTTVQPIDLTMSSPLDRSPVNTEFDVRTPELNAVDSKQKQSRSNSRMSNESDEISLAITQPPDIQKTLRTKWRHIEETEAQNSILALAKSVYLLSRRDAQMVLAHVKKLTGITGLKEMLQIYITGIRDEDSEPIRTHILKRDHDAVAITTLLFVAYHLSREVTDTNEVTPEECDEAWRAIESKTAQFRSHLLNLLQHWLQYSSGPMNKLNYQPRSSDITEDDTELESGLDAATDIDFDEPPATTQDRGRGRPKGSKNKRLETPMDVQRSGKKRMAEQARLKVALTHKLKGIMSSTGHTIVPINFRPPIVYVDSGIAPRLRAHQVDGIQFMWRELVEDPKHQGGLLAHTMGLGKTMQVITVLSTIAQCNKSPDPQIAAHIPKNLRDLRVLVLCPPTLIANWYEELVLWLPNHDTLGPIYQVGIFNNKPHWDIKQWSETGGVLLLAYNRLVSCCKPASQRSGATKEQHEEMSKWLLELPNVVIADEAHMLKNPGSKTSLYANQIVTHSRLALTGSPLSNHLEEYWAMIDFIAPKYLGERGNFQNKFVKPIELSLKEESNAYERRVGLKKLHVLKRILAPKVHRADITALANDLPSKTEFYITVPLTELQKEAYTLFVHHFRKVAAQEQYSKGNILVWIAILSLLLNHPFCFVRKLEEEAFIDARLKDQDVQPLSLSKEAERPPRTGKGDEDDVGLAEDVDISEDSAILDVAVKAIQVFQEHKVTHRMDDPVLSYRCLVVKCILEQVLALGEKTLIFSHSIPTLDYLAHMLNKMNCSFDRIDGSTNTRIRQTLAVNFNTGDSGAKVFLISTRAGGLGLNLQGATRVIVFDYGWNPSWEEQAIGRAFRMGQKKPVFVYRIRTGGTYENITFNSAVFKTQLFSRVVDHKSILRKGTKKANAEKYLFDPQDPEQKDFSECVGKDVVLDNVLKEVDCVRSIELTETFAQDIEETLTPEEELEANQEVESEKLQLTNPAEYNRQQRRVMYNAVQTPMASQVQIVQRPPRVTPGFGVIDDALHSPPIASLLEAFRQSTVPDLPSEIHSSRDYVSGSRASYGDTPRPAHGPVQPQKLNHAQPQQSLQMPKRRINAKDGAAGTDDENLQKVRGRNAPGCQSQ